MPKLFVKPLNQSIELHSISEDLFAMYNYVVHITFNVLDRENTDVLQTYKVGQLPQWCNQISIEWFEK